MKIANITSQYRANLIVESYKGWIKDKQKVLDIGTGTGVVGRVLQDKFQLALTGCDIEEYLISKIKFKKMGSNSKLPFKNKDFEIAMFNDVLHHTEYENQIKLIKDASRVSNKILIFELRPTLPGKLFDFVLNKIHNPNMIIPYTYRTESEWKKVFKDLNLKYKKRSVRRPLLYPFTHIAFYLSS